VSNKAIITIDNKPETFTIEDGHLKASKGNDKIDFVKSK
jgi:hypothetical protein